jgi:hypothetical protein
MGRIFLQRMGAELLDQHLDGSRQALRNQVIVADGAPIGILCEREAPHVPRLVASNQGRAVLDGRCRPSEDGDPWLGLSLAPFGKNQSRKNQEQKKWREILFHLPTLL